MNDGDERDVEKNYLKMTIKDLVDECNDIDLLYLIKNLLNEDAC